MAFNKLIAISVGTDLSAFRGIHDIPPILLKAIIGPRRVFQYPDLKITLHYRGVSLRPAIRLPGPLNAELGSHWLACLVVTAFHV